jgi:hypothetical protein
MGYGLSEFAAEVRAVVATVTVAFALTIKLPFPTKDGFLPFMLSVTGEMFKPICTSDCPFDWACTGGIDNPVKPSTAITAVTATPEIHLAPTLISLLLSTPLLKSSAWF